MPLQSRVIMICVTPKSCFFGIFWEKKDSHGQTVHFGPHSVRHIRKAVHLRIPKIRLKFHFRHPMERQIFGDGGRLDPALILALCPILSSKVLFMPIYITSRRVKSKCAGVAMWTEAGVVHCQWLDRYQASASRFPPIILILIFTTITTSWKPVEISRKPLDVSWMS